MEFVEVIEVDDDYDRRTDDVRTQCSFESLMISPETIAVLRNRGYRVPSPVQMNAIPLGLTGFGECFLTHNGIRIPSITETFQICWSRQNLEPARRLCFPILAVENLYLECEEVQRMIIAPTREIATQIRDTIKAAGTTPNTDCVSV
ncbi:DEAD/DEAH box helicase [Parelaphostrongylus tenuis]|uniref:RNA helicase n=1 Tax=Parelaphostrongylus tenuis TaxID=148309 RepID=A0AAD5R3X3_PARTN|nr:DEAD/DEAH box helicase [Parelaphostrongylus tenuis]